MRNLSSASDSALGNTHTGAASASAALGRYAGDQKLAAIFKQMREIVGVSQSEMARRLGTNVSTLLDFEAGAVAALPPWPETVRIVDRYAELSQIDPSPLLTRLLQLQTLPDEPSAPRPIVPVRPPRAAPVQALAVQPTPVVSPAPISVAPRSAAPQSAVSLSPPTRAAPPPYTGLTIPTNAKRAPPTQPQTPTQPLSQPQRQTQPLSLTQPQTQTQARPVAATGVQQPTIATSPSVEESSADDHAAGFDGRLRTRETTVRSARQSQTAAPTDPQALAARRKRRRRRTILVATPVLAIVLLFACMLLAPRPFYRVAQLLPASLALPLFAVLDTAVAQTATVRDGLRWIEFDDPRLRKGDRRMR